MLNLVAMELSDDAKKLLFFLDKNKKVLFLLLTIISGFIALSPAFDFQGYLSQGDHGRELYAYKKTMYGAVPYRDYSWYFGPFVIYYYSFIFKIFGASIQSALLGQNLIVILVGVFMYLICSTFMTPGLSYICALWYWAFRGNEFFYSYHHVGGVLMILITLYFLFRYIKDTRLTYVYCASICLYFLMMIRLNMGIALLVGIFGSILFIDLLKKSPEFSRRGKVYLYLLFGIPTLALCTYWLYLHPLPDYALHQSFPYANSHRGDEPVNIYRSIKVLWQITFPLFTGSVPRVALGLCLVTSIVQCCFLSLNNQLAPDKKRNLILIFGCLLISFIFVSHEFLISGVPFRFNWSRPLYIIIIFALLFYLIELGPKNLFTPTVKVLICITLFSGSFIMISDQNHFLRSLKQIKPPFVFGNNKVYTLQSLLWYKTVSDTSHYIVNNIPQDEKIFAIPHSSLYFFLTGRDSATRQLDFFQHTFIPKEQELNVLSEIEKNRVQWIIISSRINSLEPGMGFFGITHCPLIAKFINENFVLKQQFGDWKNHPGWAWNHGTRIFKRK